MTDCRRSDNIMKRKIKTSIATSIITATIFSAALAYSSSPIPFYKSFYAFAQTTQGNALSLSNLIKEGQPHQGSTLAPVTVIDFSDLQCSLCERKAVTKLRPMYTILSNILIGIMVERYKVIG